MTRCSVALADPADLMEAFQLLTSQESQDKLGYKIVRIVFPLGRGGGKVGESTED